MTTMTPRIRAAQASDLEDLTAMRCLLWPTATEEEHRAELEAYFRGEPLTTLPHTIFVAEGPESSRTLAGFAEVDLRSHADGCDPTRPVGYLEGWFVHEQMRRSGVGAALVHAAEDWARSHGCREMASDTWIDQQVSADAHQALGFEVVDRCIHFRKAL